MKKLLITGDQGFIGRHFRKHYEALGWTVLGCDIKSGLDCRNVFQQDHGTFDLVIHCAAIVGGRQMIEGHPIAVATDLSIDAEFFNWVIGTTQPRVVYFSSSAAYPNVYQTHETHEKLKESDIDFKNIKEPDLTYGWAKLTGEMLAKHVRDKGHEVYVFRPFSGYGEDQDDTYPFPSFIKRFKQGQDPFEIWGSGEQVRDFIHVDDIVGAVSKAVELGIQDPINIGSGVGTSFNELSKMVGAKKIEHLLDKPVGVEYRVSDNSKMLEFYTPKVSLAEGIERALKA